MHTDKLSTVFKKIFSRASAFSLGEAWLLSIFIALIATIAVGVHAVSLFIDIQKAHVISGQGGTGVESVSRETLTEAVSGFTARQELFGRFAATPPNIPDPSR